MSSALGALRGTTTDEKPTRGPSYLQRRGGRVVAGGGDTMERYLISFDDGWMDFPEEDLPAVGEASRRVVQEAKDAGVWIFGGGVARQQASIVATDGVVTDGPFPETKPVIGGFSIIEVPGRDDALKWAAKFAEACRCSQEVREIMYDPES
jgi:hypothetical protein